MGKGDGRRQENAEAVRANWDRAFGHERQGIAFPVEERPDVAGSKIAAKAPPVPNGLLGQILLAPERYKTLLEAERLVSHFRVALPLVYDLMVKELEQGVPPRSATH